MMHGFFSRNFSNGSSQIKGIDFDQYVIPVAHAALFSINISISAMHRLTANILDINNYLQNENVLDHERVFVSQPPYYMEWF